jgi:glycerate 2-kinase
MPMSLRDDAKAIWTAAVEAAKPGPLVKQALVELEPQLRTAKRILVLGAGKAGAAMALAVEAALPKHLDRIEGIVNVPAGAVRRLQKIRLHAARPDGSNHPTAEGVIGANEMLKLAASAGPDDVALCLLSGGGSALLPAPAAGVTLEDKQAVTKLLHRCGATIHEMNAVRKHLSAIKGGRLAQSFTGRALVSLILSDVVGDSLDVIASGPTAPDPTTFADALKVLINLGVYDQAPAAVRERLEQGLNGVYPETPKTLPMQVQNRVLANNVKALTAAEVEAQRLGYHVLNLGSYVEGETKHVAPTIMAIARSIRSQNVPLRPPVCLLVGGETTVTLSSDAGKGGRNQEFVLAALMALGKRRDVVVLSGGTDGEDGPTDAAGAVADSTTLEKAAKLGLDPQKFLDRHDAYPFFEATGDLLKTGLTQTNVMDVRVVLVGTPSSKR